MITNFLQKSKLFFEIFLIFSKSIDIPLCPGYNREKCPLRGATMIDTYSVLLKTLVQDLHLEVAFASTDYDSIRLTVEDVPLFPISSAAERLLDEKGHKAAFDLAAEIYRHVDEGKLRNAERLRRAILNRYLMQIKSSGTRKIPELSIARQRGKLFAEFFKEL
jgi:hypothetical protein